MTGVPAKPKAEPPSNTTNAASGDQIVPAISKTSLCGEKESDKQTLSVDIKPCKSGDSCPNGDDVIAVKVDDTEDKLPKKIVKKKTKFSLKPLSPHSSTQENNTEEKKDLTTTEKATKPVEKEKAEKMTKEKKEKKVKRDSVDKGPEEKKPSVSIGTEEKKKMSTNNGTERKKAYNEGTKSLPVRSLTDAEYEVLFNAVVENALNLDMEEWEPKITSPVKVKTPVKKKYSITVGKKSEQKQDTNVETRQELEDEVVSPELSPESQVGDGNKAHEVEEDPLKCGELDETDDIDANDKTDNMVDHKSTDDHNTDDDDDHNNDLDRVSDDKIVNEHKIDDDNKNNDENELNDVNDDDNNDLHLVAHDEDVNIEDLDCIMPEENEVTPATSVVDVPVPVKKKRKKISRASCKLEPKHLPFNDKNKTEMSMVDKICELKRKKKNTTVEKGNVLSNVKKEKDQSKMDKPVKKSKKKKMQERELDITGTWVMCCNSDCMKWRYLHNVSDPSQIPDRWTCSMNTDSEHNSCDKSEENYDESDHIFTKYTEGSVVWAKMSGYPWWPAMVEIDPDTETFFSTDSDDPMIPTHYHVVFLDDHVSRVWVKSDQIVQFTEEEDPSLNAKINIKKKGTSFTKDIAKAKKNAFNALKCNLKERIELFGFAARYKGPWASTKKIEVKKSKKTIKQTTDVNDDVILDDDTVDDIIDNTESLLDNVEEMLNSFDSSDEDLDADDFSIDGEKIAVKNKASGEKKRSKRKYKSNDGDEIEKMEKENKKSDVCTERSKTDLDGDDTDIETNECATNKRRKIRTGGQDQQVHLDEKIEKIDIKKETITSPEDGENILVDSKKLVDVTSNHSDVDSDPKHLIDCKDESNELVKDSDKSAPDNEENDYVESTDVDKLMEEKIENDASVGDENDELSSEDEFDILGKKDDSDLENVAVVRNTEQSLEDDEDGEDFDLAEHYMYESNTDGVSKVRDLNTRNQAGNSIVVAEVEEYSDPFELMEE
ncbi:Zinc finger CW-type PWWP domain protein 1 [Mactra antiquata]